MNKCVCESINEKNIEVQKGSWIDIYFGKNRFGNYILAEGDGSCQIYINYCPLCGKEF